MILSAVIGGADAATNIYISVSGSMSGFGAYICSVLAVAAVDAVLIYRRIRKNDK